MSPFCNSIFSKIRPDATLVIVDVCAEHECWPQADLIRAFIFNGGTIYGGGGRGALVAVDFADEGVRGFGAAFEYFKSALVSREDDILDSDLVKDPCCLLTARLLLKVLEQQRLITRLQAKKTLREFQTLHYQDRSRKKLAAICAKRNLDYFFSHHASILDVRRVDTLECLSELAQTLRPVKNMGRL